MYFICDSIKKPYTQLRFNTESFTRNISLVLIINYELGSADGQVYIDHLLVYFLMKIDQVISLTSIPRIRSVNGISLCAKHTTVSLGLYRILILLRALSEHL